VPDDLQGVKAQAANANRVLALAGMAEGVLASLGHASVRVPGAPDQFVTKGRGYAVDALALMQPEDMVVCDLEANLIEGPPGISQVSEVMLHACILRAYPEVGAVVHVHPRFATVASLLGGDLVPMCNEGNVLVRDPLPLYPRSHLIVTEEDGMAVAEYLGVGRAMLLRGHGAITVGASLEDAVVSMLELEEQAKMNWYARCAAGPGHPHLSGEDVDDWVASSRMRGRLPHFKQEHGPTSARTQAQSGLWAYLSQLAELPGA
jgi:3,4-dihydroxyphthalate decarboxylase